jgi:hypothetical protein
LPPTDAAFRLVSSVSLMYINTNHREARI